MNLNISVLTVIDSITKDSLIEITAYDETNSYIIEQRRDGSLDLVSPEWDDGLWDGGYESLEAVKNDLAADYSIGKIENINVSKIMEESAKDNQESLEKHDKLLRDTVAELCEAKRLLKAAVEDFSFVSENFISNMDSFCSMYNHMVGCMKDCPMNSLDDCGRCKWRYTDEAKKLLGGKNDD